MKILFSMKSLLLAIALLGLWVSGEFLLTIQEKKEESGLVLEPSENIPPQFALASTALGGFRGLILDYLWLRALGLREKGSHYEIVQLYNWICKLEPKTAEVWYYTAWEMSYNISVTMPTPEEKWRWVLRGIEQLRDFGIQYNPNTPKLYWELAWIFIDKLGVDAVDIDRPYYQIQWAILMEEVMGTKTVDDLCKAPHDLDLLLADTDIKMLHQEIGGEKGFWSYQMSTSSQPKWEKLLQEEKYKKAFDQLEIYFRAKKLREEFKMSPQKMASLMQKYGELDWRLASSHALYWIEEEAKIVEKLPESKQKVLIKNMDRLRHVALNQAFEYGKVVGIQKEGIVCIPNFSVVANLHQLFEDIQKRWEMEEGRQSHERFLNQAVFHYYMYLGHTEEGLKEAKKYYEILRKKFPKPLYDNDIHYFVISEIGRTTRDSERRHVVESYIISRILLAYHSLRQDKSTEAAAHYGFALHIHKIYVARHGDLENVSELQKPRTWSFLLQNALKIFKNQLSKETVNLFILNIEDIPIQETNLSPDIKNKMEEKGCKLSPNAIIEFIPEKDLWCIKDGEQMFFMDKVKNGFLVFRKKNKEEIEEEVNRLKAQFPNFFQSQN